MQNGWEYEYCMDLQELNRLYSYRLPLMRAIFNFYVTFSWEHGSKKLSALGVDGWLRLLEDGKVGAIL